MKKSKKKVFLIILITLITLLMLFPIKSHADDIDNLITSMNRASDISTQGVNSVTTGINTIFSLVRFVGSGISIIVVLMLGIKYMVASIEEKAEIKKRAMPIVIGCIILFATTNIVVIVNDIVASIN